MVRAGLVPHVKRKVAGAISRPILGSAVARLGRGRVRNHGLWIEVSDPLITPRVKAELFWNLYEGAEIRFIRRFLVGQRAVVELGGSLGIAALHALEVMDRRGRLMCVEAHPDLAAALSRRFRDDPRVKVLAAAVAYGTPRAAFAIAGSSTNSRLCGPGNQDGITVPTVTLTDVVAESGFDRYALISDIEGAEAAMLEHDGDVLQRCERAVIELHDVDTTSGRVTVAKLSDRVRELGFTVVAERGPVLALAR